MSRYTERDYQEAVDAMMLANVDYEDNKGNSEYASKFWADFVEKREHYRKVRDALGRKV